MRIAMMGSGGYPMEIIQRPEQITIIYEAHTEVRRIYINAPKMEARDMLPMGLAEGARTTRTVKRGDVIFRADVEQASGTFVGSLRQLQESALGWEG